MTHRLWLDLETYSTVDLRNATPYRYAEDPEFTILMASYSDDGELVEDLIGEDDIYDRLAAPVADRHVLKVAHNAQFERICLSAFLGLPVGVYLPPETFHDTQAVAGILGYPQKLANLARALGAAPKDEAGTLLINWFCKPDRNGKRRLPEDHPEKWAAFVRYCHQDVVTLIDVDRKLGDFPVEMERQVYRADQVVNDTGLILDTSTMEVAAGAVEANHAEHVLELSRITGLAKPNNPVTLREWLTSQTTCNGKRLRLPNLRAETVESRLAKLDEIGEPDTPLRRALELRQELAGTASKKFQAALDSVSPDGRLRGSFRYFGAHTGRWSGRGAQPHNLPRHTFDNDVDVLFAIEDLVSDGRLSPDELKRLVRALFTGPSVGLADDLTVVDYSSIEARVIAWLAGEEWALQAFRDGRDIYVETADRMGGLTRAQGKIAVLALGYNGGSNSLRAMAGPGDDFINDLSDDQIRDTLVYPWRRANPSIVQLWQELGEAFGNPMQVGDLLSTTESFDELGRAVHLWLPSGRAITYHGVEWERYVVKDPKTEKLVRKEGWRYANPKDPFNKRMRIGTYGGRLAENATQATARDVLAEALVRLVERGYRPVGHVHDEILVEGAQYDKVREVMIEPPEWADGLPIDGDGFVCSRYKKG